MTFNIPDTDQFRIVIVGSGFGDLSLALKFTRLTKAHYVVFIGQKKKRTVDN